MNRALTLGLIAVLLLAGCATFNSQQTEVAQDGTSRKTVVSSASLFDSHGDLSKFRASTSDKTQTTTIGALEQSSTSTNLVTILELMIQAAYQAGIKAAK